MKSSLLLTILALMFSSPVFSQCNLTQANISFRGINLGDLISDLDRNFEIIDKKGDVDSLTKTGTINFDDVSYKLSFYNNKLISIKAIYETKEFQDISQFIIALNQSFKLPEEWQSANDQKSLESRRSSEINGDILKIEVNAANRELKRATELLESGLISRSEYDKSKDRVEAAQSNYDKWLKENPINPDSSTYSQLVKDLAEWKTKKDNLLKLYREKHPDVMEAQVRIDKINEQIAALKQNKTVVRRLICKDFEMIASLDIDKSPSLETKIKTLVKSSSFKP